MSLRLQTTVPSGIRELSIVAPVRSAFASLLDRLVYRFRVPPRCRLHSLSIEPAVTRFYQGLVSKRHQLLSYHQSGVMMRPSFHLVPDDHQEITIVVEHETASPESSAPLDARRIDLILSGP